MDKPSILKEIGTQILGALSKSVKAKSTKLLAVSKTKSIDQILEIYNQGHRDFGENYVNELVEKSSQLPKDINWHMIGHLQSNKAKKLLQIDNLAAIETLDTEKLANELNSQCRKLGKKDFKVFIQVNISNDTKNGVAIDEVLKMADHIITKCEYLKISGLMSMGNIGEEDEFTKMYELKEQILKLYPDLENEFGLSMGTSEDYELAIFHGATEVRVGSKIFGKREYTKQALSANNIRDPKFLKFMKKDDDIIEDFESIKKI